MRLAAARVRPALFYLVPLLVLCLAVVGLAASRAGMLRARERRLQPLVRIAADLGLTDLCLATEASYTRHPAATGLTVAFQDHPGALEHFPSGSFWAPPVKVE